MSDPRPPPTRDIDRDGRLGLVERGIEVVRALTLNNVLTMAILVAVAVPAYAAWKFLTDTAFRAEFMSSYRVIDLDVPCLVAAMSTAGQAERMGVASGFLNEGRMEHLIVIRAPGMIKDSEIAAVCKTAIEEAKIIRRIFADKEKE